MRPAPLKTRWRALSASVAVAVVALLGTNAATARATGDPGLELDDFVLRPVANAASLQSTITDLKKDLPSAGVDQILQNAPRTPSCRRATAGPTSPATT